MAEVLSADVVEVVYKKKRKLTGIKCDCCGRIIPASVGGRNLDNAKYYRVTTGHHEWGSESCESIQYYDICPGCIVKFASDYLENGEYDSAYIEINRDHVYVKDRWED